MATVSSLLTALSRAYVITEADSGSDPELIGVLEEARAIHQELGWLVIRVGSANFTVMDEVIPAEDGDLAAFRDDLEKARVTEFRLQEVVEPALLERFLRALRPSSTEEGVSGPARFRGLEEAVGLSFEATSTPVLGMAGSIQDLFDSTADPDPGPEESHAETSPAEVSPEAPPEEIPESLAEAPLEASPEAPSEIRAEALVEELPEETVPDPEAPAAAPDLPSVPEELEEAVRRFAVAPLAEKAGLRRDILHGTDALKNSRAMAPLAELLGILVSPESGGRDSESAALAREIITPAIASFLAVQIGDTRDEEERARMIDTSAGLGKEMALALADALGEARDRYQRRSYMDAMLAQGPLALEVAQGMVEDPRWFVVRNGVSIIGEMGGEGTVSHLTGSLANGDARVRKETVLALAKLGGGDAEQLLLGMLDDQDTQVRAMACRAVGVLGVEKAFRSLMRILEEDQDQDVQVECLQALGKIGDPGAVPMIEKRAVKGLFSRPSQEIRVAAYRALAGIGTPHAKSLLEKASKDSDPGVRMVVQGLLS